MAIKFLKTESLKNKTVLLRADLNVPIENGLVADDFRIRESLPTLSMLNEGGNKIVIIAHLGRPGGKPEKDLSLKPIAEKLARLLGLPFAHFRKAWPPSGAPRVVFFDGNILEDTAKSAILQASSTDIVVLENIRFYKGEENNDPMLVKKLAALGEAYVNEAFSVDHRHSASLTGLPEKLSSFGGPLLEKEIKSLNALLLHSGHPFVVVMGGIKISEKAKTLENLGKRADKILLGGGLANLIFRSKGFEVGLSKVEAEAEKIAWELEKNYKDKLFLPVDVVVSKKDMNKNDIRVCSPYEIKPDEQVLDCGPKTILEFSRIIKTAKTIVWNGPLGHFEIKPFDTATMALARLIGGRGTGHAYAVVGGGETVDAIRQAHQLKHIDHVSTGGGAMLEFLAGKKLPGIEALS